MQGDATVVSGVGRWRLEGFLIFTISVAKLQECSASSKN